MHKNHGEMGFKDLTNFNLSMLGKKCWKFQTDKTSLVSHNFKDWFFLSWSYLTANLGHNMSFVWRSILRACLIVSGGAR